MESDISLANKTGHFNLLTPRFVAEALAGNFAQGSGPIRTGSSGDRQRFNLGIAVF
jgi:hypothetical protein